VAGAGVNVPNVAYAEISGIETTRLGRRHKAEPVLKLKTPRGETAYWIGPAGGAQDAGPGTDFFAVEHGALWEAFVTMAIIGLGLGFTFAAIPGLIIGAVPAGETGSAMGFYQVVRYIGFSLGSALAAAILAGHTSPGAHLPTEGGYVTALWAAAVACVGAALLAWFLPAAGGPPSRALGELETEEGELGAAGVVGIEQPVLS